MTRANEKSSHGWLRWVRDLTLIALALILFSWWQTRDAARGPAPALVGQLIDGQLIELKDYRGKPLLVHFWAIWCPICRLENGAIDSLADDYQVLTIATSSGSPRKVGLYLEQEQLTFPVMVDESGDLARRWGVSGVPVSFVIDPDGNIGHIASGFTSGAGLRARMWLAGR